MATKKQRADAAKKKEKRTKIIAIVGFLLLAAVAAYEVPSMMKVMNKKPPPSTYDPGPSTVAGGLPNVAAPAGGSSQLASASAPAATEGQLVSFDVFQSKNPFAPQVSARADASTTETGAGATTAERPGADTPSSRAATPATTTPTVTTPAPAPTPTPPTPPAPAVPATTTPVTTTTAAPPPAKGVSLKVNGVVSHVATNDTFPAGAPVFRLVGWTKTTAEISIVGGSYATGAPTLKLTLARPVTLENQTNGKRYTVELLSTD